MRAEEQAVVEPKAKPCRPHGWKTPEPGDTHLVCEKCDRRLSFREEMTTFKYMSIEPLAKLLGLAAWRSPQFSW